MSVWHEGPMACFDTETTGVSVDGDRIVTATLIDVEGDPRVGVRGWVKAVHEWLIAVDVGIPAAATAVHSVTTDHARAHGTDPAQAIFEIVGELGIRLHRGVPVVGHNVVYDLTILDREARRHRVDTLDSRSRVLGPVVDTLVIDKAVSYRKGSRRLADLAAHYNVAGAGAWHTSTADALAAGRIAHALAVAYPDRVQVPLRALHDAQVGWKREQAASFQRYLRQKKGQSDAVIPGAWPCQPLPAGWDPATHVTAEPVGASS